MPFRVLCNARYKVSPKLRNRFKVDLHFLLFFVWDHYQDFILLLRVLKKVRKASFTLMSSIELLPSGGSIIKIFRYIKMLTMQIVIVKYPIQ